MNFKKLLLELRWRASRDAVDYELACTCDDAADALDRACKLAGAIDRYTKEPNARNWSEVILARKAFK